MAGFSTTYKYPKGAPSGFHQQGFLPSLPNLKGRNSTPWPWIAGCFPRTLYKHTIPQRRKKCCCSLGPSESMLDWHFFAVFWQNTFFMRLQPQATVMDWHASSILNLHLFKSIQFGSNTTMTMTMTIKSKTSPHPNAWCFRTPARRASVTPQERSFISWDVNTQIHQTKKNWKPASYDRKPIGNTS